MIGVGGKVKQYSNVLDKPLSKGRQEVSLSAFAFLFSEIVQYNQTQVDNISELERRYSFAETFEKKMGRWAIAVHGGVGVDPNLPEARQQSAKSLLTHCLTVGTEALKSGARAIDVVESIVRVLESDPLFNSGRGSALSRNGTVEMGAGIMDGNGRRCSAVSGVKTVKNPISLARLVMDKSPHCYLGFNGAEEFARDQGVEMVDNDYFITENTGMLKLAKEANTIMFDYRIPLPETCSATAGSAMATSDSSLHMNGLPIGIDAPETVGCAVVDSYGNCTAATSTGGLMNKMNGRIGRHH